MPTGSQNQEPRFRNMLLEHDGLATEMSTGTCVTNAVTINDYIGMITTEALTTAQNAIETITLTNSMIAAADMVNIMLALGTSSAGTPMLGTVTPAAGSCVIKVINKHASAVAFNGTLKIGFQVIKAL